MSRPLRIEFPGAFYHVMSRGNERKSISINSDDCHFFLKTLADAAGRWQLAIHAYALMGNHYHLLLETKAGLLSMPMRHINGVYTQYFNKRHQRIGHLFHGRFKAILIEKDSYLLTLSRYIHQNPLKAGLVAKAEDYPWSSYQAYLGLTPQPPWLATHDTLQEFGSALEIQRQRYQQFMEAHDEKDPQSEALGKLILGSNAFITIIKRKIAKLSKKGKEYAYQKTWLPRIPPETTLESVCRSFGITRSDLLAGRWSRETSKPLAMTLLRDCSRLTLREIAALFNLNYPAVSVSIKRFEKKIAKDRGLRKKFEDIEQNFAEMLNVKM